MPGPAAKDPSVRTRRNKTSTRATMVKKAAPAKAPATAEQVPDVAERKTPSLPDSIEWYQSVTEWWNDLWTSEPRDQWIDADVHLLFVAARLYQAMLDPQTKVTAAKALAGEFRQIMVQFGLTPMARRTLQWEITTPDTGASAQKTTARKAAPKANDPRAKFRIVAGGA